MMHLDFQNAWFLFCVAFGLMLFATLLLSLVSLDFYTMDPLRRKGSMLALEFPAKETEVSNILKGIFLLGEEDKKASLRSFRWQIILDFILFMPATYGSIFILCYNLSVSMYPIGRSIFEALAYAQIICFVLDTIENIYLLSNLKPDAKPASRFTFKAMQLLEVFKWGLACTGGFGGLSVLCFYWLSGRYSAESLPYILIFLIEIILFIVLAGMIPKVRTNSSK